MKQILQNLGDGTTELVEAPVPQSRNGHLLIDTHSTLISIGTERMLVEFGKSGLLAKARQQPEKVRQVLQKIGTDGLLPTIEAVRSKLGQPIPLGYSNVGVVSESCAEGYAAGDRVVSNGPHADVVCVPKHLCAKIPDNVSDDQAVFTVVASIGLQGIRLAQPTLGENIVVIGAGLIGLLTVQMLLAHGCNVLAIDFDSDKLALAKSYGAKICDLSKGESAVAAGLDFSQQKGVDAVLITASTNSNEPVTSAAQMCRKRGRIILVGVAGLALNRADFYDKELMFQVSCSYGPGRYDLDYEQAGHDYPIGFVRWTEQRNFEAVLGLMAAGKIDTSSLISKRFQFEEASSAYQFLSDDTKSLGVILDYPHSIEARHKRTVRVNPSSMAEAVSKFPAANLGMIGAGNYASRVLIPAFNRAGARMQTLSSAGGINAVVHAKNGNFNEATSDTSQLLTRSDIDAVAIVTRHDSHAALTCDALNAGKHVFVEKPLALTHEQLSAVTATYNKANRLLMVGFNRRFAPLTRQFKRLCDSVREPKSLMLLMNAGAIPIDHWTQDPAIGGGRIIGEACHHIDLARYLIGSPITSVDVRRLGGTANIRSLEDKAVILLGFEDGSFATIHYLANGAAAFPKERIELFAGNRTLILDNFISLTGYNWPGFRRKKLWKQDKGQNACAEAFVSALKNGGPAPIDPQELFEVSRVAIEAAEKLREQR